MLGKILSSIGIGAAKVDLLLPKQSYKPGERISGVLRLESGKADQEVNNIYLKLQVNSRYGDGDEAKHVNKVLDAVQVSGSLLVKAGAPAQEIPVHYDLPENIPLSAGPTRFYLITGLDISLAIDPGDRDPIVVEPDWRRGAVLRALTEELGFRPTRDSGEYNGYIQEFEFKPTGFMRGKLDELEVIFQPAAGGIRVHMEIDRKGGLLELFNLDESRAVCFLSDGVLQSVPETARELANFITRQY